MALARCSSCGSVLASAQSSCLRCGSRGANDLRPSKPVASGEIGRCRTCGSVLPNALARCLRCGGRVNQPSDPTRPTVRRPRLDKQGPSARAAHQKLGLTAFYGGDDMVDALAEPSDAEIEHWLQAVRLSTPVACNVAYAELAEQTSIVLDRDEAELNAFAAHPPDQAPIIVVFGGLVRAYAATAVAATLAFEESAGDVEAFANAFSPRFQRVASRILDSDGGIEPDDLRPSDLFPFERMVPHDLIQRSRSYLTGMMLNLIAHEMGHVVLRHNASDVPPGGSPAQLAMEHQADAFARAVCESVPFQSEVTFAGFLDALLWAWISRDNSRPTTHPGARSRLLRFVDENEQLFRLGISPATLPQFLPQA